MDRSDGKTRKNRKQLLDYHMEKRRYWKLKARFFLENSLRKKLCACR